jgi:protein TonB
MISFTQNLYRSQWLDLVFKNRNQAYGAYELRKNNAGTTVKAFLYAAAFFSLLVITPWLIHQITKTNPAGIKTDPIKIIEVNLLAIVKQEKPEIKPVAKASVKPLQHKSIQYAKMQVVPENQAESDIPTKEELSKAVISTANSEGEESLNINPIDIQESSPGTIGNSTSTTESMELHTLNSIENYPEFPGGQAAFIKFLSRNLKYPHIAAEKGIMGKVLISFIIEKNGKLSNIKILRGIGYGCDEEAIRVLEKSPEWKPGMQNKQHVRVAYTLPINFSLPD